MPKKYFKIILLTFLFLAIFFTAPSFASAADVYMSTTGTKTSGASTAGDWSNANCYNNLHAAMQAMSGGDTLTIDDGVYTGATNQITQVYAPPSGSVGVFTAIRARHIPCHEGYACNVPLTVFFPDGIWVTGSGLASSYVKFWGIRFAEVNTYTGWDHLYFKQCAFLGVTSNPVDGQTTAMGTGGAYNLLEDCVFYGKGRYKLNFYDYTRTGVANNNVCRRCVARNDFAMRYHTGQNQPIATFSSYYSRGSAFLNTIDIDSDQPDFWDQDAMELAGSFYQPVDTGEHGMLIQGSIVINSALGVGFTEGTGNTLTDVAAVKTGGGLWTKPGGAVINRLSLINSSPSNYSYTAEQLAALIPGYYGIAGYTGQPNINNSILRTINTNTAIEAIHNASADYVNTHNLSVALGSTPTHHITTDPFTNGLLYPVRIETGSTLKTAGSGGGQVGATILYKLGVDGTFKNDADWNTEQGSLWPFPLEDWIKAEMASMPAMINGESMPSSTRGFASPTAKQLDGTSDTTLTSYIWESLGNQMPCEIYETCSGDSVAPSAPLGLSVL